ncbi:MAG: PQQ-binding-like beta-propeller repeat protein [Planctomycetes bacterium]|nr:PQQ-binding-like beta-propeller repeat protein [Planctomycetota bacterium]
MLPLLIALVLTGAPDSNWVAFRGTYGNSLAPATKLPLTWSQSENVAWRVKLRGSGQSSPIVWEDKVFVSSAEGKSKGTLVATCINLANGAVVWEKKLASAMPQEDNGYVSKAAPTPTVDSERAYFFFESGDLLSLSHAGELVWKRSLSKEYGPLRGNHGLGSSLALTDGAVIVLVDHDGQSYMLSVDRETGKNRWKIERTSGSGWSSPIVARFEDAERIYVSISKKLEAFDAASGKRLWHLDGLDGNNVPSPTLTKDLVVIGSGSAGFNLGIRRGGSGDVKMTHVAWSAQGVTSSFPSPLVHNGRVYFVGRSGALTCVDAADGKVKWQKRLPAACWASPIGADEQVYFFCKDGTTLVLKADETGEELAKNQLPVDDVVYGVAAVRGSFVVRTGTQLTRIGTP